jgi:hypothetical protein
MICRVVYILIMCHLSALGDVVDILFLKRKEKEKFSYCTSLFVDVTKGSLHMWGATLPARLPSGED